MAGGYSGDDNAYMCHDSRVRIRYVGKIAFRRASYNIYILIYVGLRAGDGLPGHGGERILMFRDGAYVGQFHLDTPPYYRVSVKGRSIRINTKAKYGNEIRMTEAGPPPNAFLAQDTDGLFR
jgi:hypothetical protein